MPKKQWCLYRFQQCWKTKSICLHHGHPLHDMSNLRCAAKQIKLKTYIVAKKNISKRFVPNLSKYIYCKNDKNLRNMILCSIQHAVSSSIWFFYINKLAALQMTLRGWMRFSCYFKSNAILCINNQESELKKTIQFEKNVYETVYASQIEKSTRAQKAHNATKIWAYDNKKQNLSHLSWY